MKLKKVYRKNSAIPLKDRPPVAQRLDYAMRYRGMNNHQLCLRSGYADTTVSNLRAGAILNPKANTLYDFAVTLDINPAWLAFGMGEMIQDK